LLDGRLVHDDDILFFAKQLGASEAHRYNAFKRRERKRQFLLGRMLLRCAAARLLSLPPDALAIVEKESHAPELVLPDARSAPPRFSLSHSRDWVACAASLDVSLGVDIEFNEPTRNIFEASLMAFHATEYRWLLRQSEAARLSAFYQIWCAREALYKLMSALGRRTVLSPLVGMDGALASHGPGWFCYALPHFALTIAVCSDQPLSAPQHKELAGLSRADWLALGREFRTNRGGTDQRRRDDARCCAIDDDG